MAEVGASVQAVPKTPLGYQQLTASMLSTAQSLEIPGGSVRAHVQSNGGTGTRWRSDGTDPSSTVGMLLDAGDETDFYAPLAPLRFIGIGTNSVLDVTYYG